MPDKEGSDDEKTTKDVVNKKQKQMMNKEEYTIEMVRKIKKIINPKAVFPPIAQNKVKGEIVKGDDLKIDNKNPVKKQKKNLDEEGYDIARDMGRVPKTKDKRDASSYPVSKEVRNMKGDTPMQKEFKKKYGKKATALDAVKQKYKGQMMDVKKEELDLTQVAEAFGGYIIEEPLDFTDKQQADVNKILNKLVGTKSRARKTAKKVIRKSPIMNPSKSRQAIEKSIRRKKTGTGPNQNPEYQKLMNQQRRRQQEYDAYDDSDSGRPETGNTLNNTKNTNKNQQTFDKMFKDARRRKSGEKPVIDDPFEEPKTKTKTKTKTKPLPPPEIIVTKTKSGKVTGDVLPNFVGPKRARSKTATQNRTLQRIRVASRTAKMPVKRLVKPTGSALAKTAKFAGKNPFAALVGASMAKDQFFPAALPKPPTVQGGKVGRRTAG